MCAPIRKLILVVSALALMLGSCRKAPPKPKSQSQLALEATKQRRMVTNFARSIRNVVVWRQSQPVAETEEIRRTVIAELVRKLDEIPATELPPQLAEVWARLIDCWHQLAREPNASQELIQKGEQATQQLNILLASNGHPDVRL